MPVFASQDTPPIWCQLRHFDIVRLEPGQSHAFDRRGAKEKLIVGRGRCRVSFGQQTVVAKEGSNLDLTVDGAFAVDEVEEAAVLIRMAGDWGEELGGSGLFSGVNSASPQDKGDPVDYPKTTNFDCHFHDCDEYWIVFEGEGLAYSEGKPYRIGPGDCLATGMGHHHDLPQVVRPLRAVFFETTLEGAKRRGHLWDHTHGTAQPRPERV